MCGRYVSASAPDELAAYFDAAPAPADVVLPPSWNVAPTDDVWGVVVGRDGTRQVAAFHWGLVPAWASSISTGVKMINARADTLATRNAYKHAFRRRRLLVPMDGFYEWKAPDPRAARTARPGTKPKKQPIYVTRLDGEPMAAAGLWERWRDRDAGDDAPWLHSLTIITTDANATMAPVHDRMPVLLPPSDWTTWLDPEVQDVDALQGLLVPAPDDLLQLTPVGYGVNDVRSKGPELIDEVDPDEVAASTAKAQQQDLFGLGR